MCELHSGRRIVELASVDDEHRRHLARILVDGFRHMPSAWSDLAMATDEVESFLTDPDRFAFVALEGNQVRGWIGAIRQTPFAWEMHPLVVDPEWHGDGWGRLLVEHLESEARAAGILTIWLGTDDDFGGTNLFGRDLFPDVLAKLGGLRPTTGHPFVFYERLGYTVTGVFPDVDGVGKHDILMAKRISPGSA